VHSEANPSPAETVHLYQIWLLPEREGLAPSYEQRAFPEAERRGRLRLVASPDGREGSLTIRQDAALYLGTLNADGELSRAMTPGRHAWLQLLRGAVQLNGRPLAEGDGAAISEERLLSIRADRPSEILLFDLA
jgi:redox-sensitive bicupin YhaK (pirin superfamily)